MKNSGAPISAAISPNFSPAAGEKFGEMAAEMGAPEFFTGLFLSEDEAGAPAQTQAPEVNE